MSFNSLFGLGNNASDANLEVFLPLQDDDANNNVLDYSDHERHGVIQGGDTSDTLSTTGPNSWATKALNLDGTNDYIKVSNISATIVGGDISLLAMVRMDLNHRFVACSLNTASTNNGARLQTDTSSPTKLAYSLGGVADYTSVTLNLPSISTWYSICDLVDGTSIKYGVDGTYDNRTVGTLSGTFDEITIGGLSWTSVVRLNGQIANAAIFTRVLSEAEEAEYRAGPEPINVVAPLVTGLPQIGSLLTCDPGTWGLDAPYSSGTNGTITYTYQWVRGNSDYSGGSDISGATSSTYTLTSSDIGYYVWCRVRATNDGGFDSNADTNSNILEVNVTFNSLFGLGAHSADANLEGWWPLQDDAASTTVLDYSGNSLNGTLLGGSNTSDISIAGPNNWLTKSLDFPGSTTDYITVSSSVLNASETNNALSIVAFANPDTVHEAIIASQWTGSQFQLWMDTDGGVGWAAAIASSIKVGESDNNATAATWQCPGFSWSGTELKSFLNGVHQSTNSTSGTFPLSLGSLFIGYVTGKVFNGKLAGIGLFSRSLSETEFTKCYTGPEPINTSAPVVAGLETVGSILACTTGTWGLDAPFSSGSNGTITYEYQWTRSDDATGTNETDITGATRNIYQLTSADQGKYIRCLVRGINDGGYDALADTNSNFTGAIGAVNNDAFNLLFGLGENTPDANLEGWWPLQDDAASTTIVDYSGNGNNLTLNGGANSEDNSVSLGSWFVKGLSFDGIGDYIQGTTPNGIPMTLSCFLHSIADGENGVAMSVANNSVDNQYVMMGPNFSNTGDPIRTILRQTSSTFVYSTTGPLSFPADFHASGTTSATGYTVYAAYNGEAFNNASTLGPSTGLNTIAIGRLCDSTPSGYITGTVSNASIFSRKITDSENFEIASGPEPINIVAPSITQPSPNSVEIGDMLTCDPGTWGLDAPFSSGDNGTILTTYQWYRYDIHSGTATAIPGALLPMYTVQAADNGKHLRCLVRASNDGGYDTAADEWTEWVYVSSNIGLVDYTTNNGSSGTVTSSAIDTTDATLLILCVNYYGSNEILTSDISDSAGNTWTALTEYTGTGIIYNSKIFYCESPTTSTSHIVTVTKTTSYPCINFSSWIRTSSFDSESGQGYSGVTIGRPGSITPVNDNSLFITSMVNDTNKAYSIDSSFIELNRCPYTSGVSMGGEYAYLVQGTAAATNPAWTWSGGEVTAINMAVWSPLQQNLLNITRELVIQNIAELLNTYDSNISNKLDLTINRSNPYSYNLSLQNITQQIVHYLNDVNAERIHNIFYGGNLSIDATREVNLSYLNDLLTNNALNVNNLLDISKSSSTNLSYESVLGFVNNITIHNLSDLLYVRPYNIGHIANVSNGLLFSLHNILNVDVNNVSNLYYYSNISTLQNFVLEYLQGILNEESINIIFDGGIAVSAIDILNINYLSDLSFSKSLGMNNLLNYEKQNNINLSSLKAFDNGYILDLQNISNTSKNNTINVYNISNKEINNDINISWLAQTVLINLTRDININWRNNLALGKNFNIEHRLDLSKLKEFNVNNSANLSINSDLNLYSAFGVSSLGSINIQNLSGLSLDKIVIINYDGIEITAYFIWTLPSRDFDWQSQLRDFGWELPSRDSGWDLDTR